MKKIKIKWDKNYAITTAVTTVVMMLLGWLAHRVILADDFAQHAEIFRARSESMDYIANVVVGHLIMAAALVWLYRQGKDNKPFVGQGVRFGLAISGVTALGMGLVNYALYPISWEFASKMMVVGTIMMMITGVVIARLSKK